MIRASVDKNELFLPVRVTPKGGRDCILPGVEGDTVIRLKVSAPPEDGKANQAVIQLLSGMLKTPKSRFRIARGEKSREKQVALRVQDEDEAHRFIARLREMLGIVVECI